MDPLIGVLGGIGALGSLFSSSETNASNLQATRETNEMNERLFHEQLAYNERMWNAQNAYNTPAAQRQRYEAAGINPYLALGNMQSGQAEMSTAGQPNPMVAPRVQPLDFSGFSQTADMMQRGQLIQAQSDNFRADADIKRIKAKTQLVRDLADLSEVRSRTSLNSFQRRLVDSQINQLKIDIQSLDERNRAGIELSRANARVQTANAVFQEWQNVHMTPLMIKKVQSEIGVNYAQAKSFLADIGLKAAQSFAARQGAFYTQTLNYSEQLYGRDLKEQQINKVMEEITKSQQWRELNIPQDKALRYARQLLDTWFGYLGTAAGATKNLGAVIP